MKESYRKGIAIHPDPESRSPDIGVPRNVRSGSLSGGVGLARGGRSGEGEADAGWWMDSEPQPEFGTRESGGSVVEQLAQGFCGEGAMGGAEWSQGEAQLVVGDLKVGGCAEQLVQQRSALLTGAGVVWA